MKHLTVKKTYGTMLHGTILCLTVIFTKHEFLKGEISKKYPYLSTGVKTDVGI